MQAIGTHRVLRGRSAELASAVALLRRARRTGQGSVVLVTGEAGAGKTALLSEVVRAARAAGTRVAASKADAVGRLSPGAPLLSALRSGSDPLLDREALAELTRLVPQPLLAVEAVSDAFERLVAGGPLLVVLDDVQWADRLTLLALRVSTSRLAGSPVVWLLATRSSARRLVDDVDVAGAGAADVHTLDLPPLGPDDVDAIARDRLGAPPSPAVRRMLDGVRGNTFLAVEILDGVARARARGEDPDALPTEFLVAVRRTLAGLTPPESEVVRAAAVLGRAFVPDEVLDLLAGHPRAAASSAVEGAVGSGLLAYRGHSVGFRHDLVREAVDADLAAAERRSLHARWARVLLDRGGSPLTVAPHVSASAGPGDPGAVELLLRAAEQARTALPATARELAREAIALAVPALFAAGDPRGADAAERGVRVLVDVQAGTDAVAAADRVLVHLTEPAAAARVLRANAAGLERMGRFADAVARLDTALGSPGVPEVLRARLSAARALASIRLRPAADARRDADAALARAHAVGDETAAALALRACAEVAKTSGHHGDALAAFRALRARTGLDHVEDEVVELQLLDRYDEARMLLDAARAAGSGGSPDSLPSLLFAQMWHDFDLAAFDDAEAGAQTLVEVSRDVGTRVYELEAHMVLSAIALGRGQVDEARSRLVPATVPGDGDEHARLPGLVLLQGWLAAAGGDPGRAVGLLRAPLAGALDSRTYWPWWPGWMPVFAHIGVAAGDHAFVDRAIAVAEEGAARNPGVASFEGIALQLRAEQRSDSTLARRAADTLANSPRPVLRAGGFRAYGRLLLAQGHVAEGAAQLDRAREVYDGIGDAASQRDLQRELRAAGVRRADRIPAPARPRSGWEALTTSERRVATLISDGHTNGSAARALRLSPNTVGTHVRSIFSKLGVQSRVQMANAVRVHLG